MGDVYWGVHLPLASLISRNGVRFAVETGTFFGSGSVHLACLFERVWTIEKNPSLFKMCKSLYGHIDNIEFVNASAARGLEEILHSAPSPMLLFLDAHWFPNPALDESRSGSPILQCELLDEITVIARYQRANQGSIIIVDDADMFLGSLPPIFDDSQFPSISSIINALRDEFGADVVEVIDDVIFACSLENHPILDHYKEIRKNFGQPSYKRVG